MSLTTVSTGNLIRQQIIYKCYAMADLWRSLVVIQLIAIFFSAIGTGGMSTSDDMFSLSISSFSNDAVFMFTVFWILVSSALITSKGYRYEDFSYVTTRLISQVSNGILLLSTVLVASLFTVMSNYVIYMAVYLFRDIEFYPGLASVGAPGELLLTFLAMTGYLLLASAAGYFFGVLIQISKYFIAIIPIMIFGPTMVRPLFIYEFGYDFYAQEPSVFLFLVKTIGTALALYACGVALMNRKEVREI